MDTVNITVNGRAGSHRIEPQLLLVHYIRRVLGLTGTHIGCESSQCGACTVLLDGLAVKSCTVFAVQADGAAITTIEGLTVEPAGPPVQAAFHNWHGLQCGFCTPGILIMVVALLRDNPDPDEAAVRRALQGHFCRCTGYHNVVEAVLQAAQEIRASNTAPPV